MQMSFDKDRRRLYHLELDSERTRSQRIFAAAGRSDWVSVYKV